MCGKGSSQRRETLVAAWTKVSTSNVERIDRFCRYGLIGRNGVGKTTLLSHMASGRLVGFPLHVCPSPDPNLL